MKRPRQPRGGYLTKFDVACCVDMPISDYLIPKPREWRRAAAWLRRVADWWEFLADQQEMKQTRPIRRRLWARAKEWR